MTSPRIWVVGSANYDLVFRTERFPKSGETILGGGFSSFPGGKGANQAVAIARLGGNVHFVGMVGNDGFGHELTSSLQESGVRTENLAVHPSLRSGCASVMMDAKGSNQIIVAPGSNMGINAAQVETALASANDDPVLLQLEIPMECNLAAAKMSRRVFVNPAPAATLPDALLNGLFAITPNEHEAEAITGISTANDQGCRDAAQYLLDKGIERVVLTLGERGCYWRTRDSEGRIPAHRVTAVDTVGAGDAFNGGLAYFFAQGEPWDRAIELATIVAALSVTRHGAQASMPTLLEVERFMASL